MDEVRADQDNESFESARTFRELYSINGSPVAYIIFLIYNCRFRF